MEITQKKVLISITLSVVLIFIALLLFLFIFSKEKTIVVNKKKIKTKNHLSIKPEKKKRHDVVVIDNNKKKLQSIEKITVKAKQPIKKGENSFFEVEKHLQKGSDFYLYFSSKKFVSEIHKKLLQFQKNISVYQKKSRKKDNKDLIEGFQLINAVVNGSGLYDISGGGISIKSKTPKINEYRFFLHHYKKNSSGRLWKAFGGTSHKLEELNMLPPNTCFAVYQEFDFKENWNWINKMYNENSISSLSKELNKADKKLKKDGFNMKKLFASIDNKMGMVVTTAIETQKQQNSNKKNRKTEKAQRTHSFVFFIKVKNDYLFNLIKAKLISKENTTNARAVRKDVLKTKVLKLQNSFFLNGLLIVQTKGYLMFASNLNIVNTVFNNQKNKANLLDTESFKTISKGIPLEGNGFIYINTRPLKFLNTLQNFASGFIKYDTAREMLKKETAKLNSQNYSYFVFKTLDDGILIQGNSNSNVNAAFSGLIFLTPIAILNSAYIPAFSIAHKAMKEKQAKEKLNKLSTALHKYAKKHKGYFPKPLGVKGLELLRKTQSLSYSLFISPFSSKSVPGKENKAMEEENTSYVYFGGLKLINSSNIPILFDKPGEFKGNFHILLTGGKVLTVNKKFKTCTEVMKYLFKKYKYSKKVKRFLLKKAKLADTNNKEKVKKSLFQW